MTLPVAEPFAVAFECSGHASAAEAALGQLDYAGTLVIVGTGFEPPRYNQNRMIIFELEIIGAYNYDEMASSRRWTFSTAGRCRSSH